MDIISILKYVWWCFIIVSISLLYITFVYDNYCRNKK
nr:MAG TPA: hypothetical protein [Caudoviricetes sp.]